MFAVPSLCMCSNHFIFESIEIFSIHNAFITNISYLNLLKCFQYSMHLQKTFQFIYITFYWLIKRTTDKMALKWFRERLQHFGSMHRFYKTFVFPYFRKYGNIFGFYGNTENAKLNSHTFYLVNEIIFHVNTENFT